MARRQIKETLKIPGHNGTIGSNKHIVQYDSSGSYSFIKYNIDIQVSNRSTCTSVFIRVIYFNCLQPSLSGDLLVLEKYSLLDGTFGMQSKGL
jgi:hypothetical protein